MKLAGKKATLRHMAMAQKAKEVMAQKRGFLGGNNKIYEHMCDFNRERGVAIFQGLINPDTFSTQSVPYKIACDMLDLLPEDVWNTQTTFCDICIKSGSLLEAVVNRLIEKVDYSTVGCKTESEARMYIRRHQIYGIAFNPVYASFGKRVIATGTPPETWFKNDNIKCPYKTSPNDTGIPFEEFLKVRDYAKLNETIAKNFTDSKYIDSRLKEWFGDNMKFNVVLGNPPYNNDIYIDFVQLGFKISSQYCLMITPAKWQAKGGSKNELFRKTIVPNMSKIVYYKDSTDVFDIEEWGGISYYLVDKEKHIEKLIKNICHKNSVFNCDFQKHDELVPVTYSRDILNIIGKAGQLGAGFKQSLYVKNTDHGESSIAGQLGFKRQTFVGEQDRGTQEIPTDYVEVMQGENVCGYKKKSDLFTQFGVDRYKCTTSIMPGAVAAFDKNDKVLGMFKISINRPNQVPKGSFPVLKYFDTEDECKSFIQYMNTNLVKFLYFIGTCGSTLTKEFFRFVPDPGPFDHIFTDQELYTKYKLSEEEINIIESVIKERKK